MRGEAAALRLVGPGVTAWYSAPCCAGGRRRGLERRVWPAKVSRSPGGWSGGAAGGDGASSGWEVSRGAAWTSG
jgi:hypothetical protein